MTETIRETTTTQENTNPAVNAQGKREATGFQTIAYLVYFFFVVLEILLGFRLVLKLIGANTGNSFVGLIYGLTGTFITPFEGIFRRGFVQGIDTTSVFEPSTLIAIFVYAVLAWGIVKLIRIFSGERQQTD